MPNLGSRCSATSRLGACPSSTPSWAWSCALGCATVFRAPRSPGWRRSSPSGWAFHRRRRNAGASSIGTFSERRLERGRLAQTKRDRQLDDLLRGDGLDDFFLFFDDALVVIAIAQHAKD